MIFRFIGQEEKIPQGATIITDEKEFYKWRSYYTAKRYMANMSESGMSLGERLDTMKYVEACEWRADRPILIEVKP